MALNWFKRSKKEPNKKPVAAREVPDDVQVVDDRPSVPAPSNPALKNFHVSEKSTRAMEYNHYTFAVAKNTTKTQVRDAVERAYKVDVTGVNMINLPAKKRRVGRREGVVPARKKAVVMLKEGQTISAAKP